MASNPVDFVLRPGDTIQIEWSGEVRTIRAGDIELGADGEPSGIRLRDLTEANMTELTASAAGGGNDDDRT